MRIAIATLGCKINQYDSAVIQTRLGDVEHDFIPFGEKADLYIINTCTVTDRADWEARQLIRRAKKFSPKARVLVTGCYAQVKPQALAEVPGVDYVVGLPRTIRPAGQLRSRIGSISSVHYWTRSSISVRRYLRRKQ